METGAVLLSTPWAGVHVDLTADSTALSAWGPPPGPGAPDTQDDLSAILDRGAVHGSMSLPDRITLLPDHSTGTPLRPGVLGHRNDGTAWSPVFSTTLVERNGQRVVVHAEDRVARLSLRTEIELGELLAVSITLTNNADDPYWLDALLPTIELPPRAAELMGFQGRWANELQPDRRSWAIGTSIVENRRGRTSHDHFPLVVAGTEGFGEWVGEVWCLNLAWSGNHHMLVHALTDGRRAIQFGELLHPGEVVLEAGESYSSPMLLGAYSGSGLTPASWRFHRHLRALPSAPLAPRPVSANTWEAVYFEHRPERLMELAGAAAMVGVERFVLDDGWFSSRRNDTSGLGDWNVSTEVYPNGLEPLIDHVRSLGMQFGLWVEPEMANPDSALLRAHPEWALTTPGYTPALGRNQLVLDLTNDEAFAAIFDAMDLLLARYRIDYLKWDMNRDHVQASSRDGRAATHRQTLAVYRMIDGLRARHPHVEIESCSSGGGRMDLGMLARTQRVWLSDTNDALDRQRIQRSASLFLAPELMGTHIGPFRSHTTGRRHDLAFRAATAMFGHLGTELDLLSLSDQERSRLAEAIELHKRFRNLLHHGDTVRFDHPDPTLLAHGVYAPDRSEALVCIARIASGASLVTAPLQLPDLAPDVSYRIAVVPTHAGDTPHGPAIRQPRWATHGARARGATLASVGLQPPVLWPEQAVLVHLTC